MAEATLTEMKRRKGMRRAWTYSEQRGTEGNRGRQHPKLIAHWSSGHCTAPGRICGPVGPDVLVWGSQPLKFAQVAGPRSRYNGGDRLSGQYRTTDSEILASKVGNRAARLELLEGKSESIYSRELSTKVTECWWFPFGWRRNCAWSV